MENGKDLAGTVLMLSKKIKSIADIGLLYSKDDYDRERYHELQEISLQLMSELTAHPVAQIKEFYTDITDYPTPKVDVRGFIMNNAGEILLVKERADSRWTLPGGWADIGLTPSEVIVKEVKEETGLDVRVNRLLAVFDKKMHPHPPQPYYVYKFVFLCDIIGQPVFTQAFDILDTGFFKVSGLPELSEDRILRSQIETLYNNLVQQQLVPVVD